MAMSPADKTYLTAMIACEKQCIQVAKTYLDAGPGERNANLSEMARTELKDDTAEMAQMTSMLGAKPMPAKPGM